MESGFHVAPLSKHVRRLSAYVLFLHSVIFVSNDVDSSRRSVGFAMYIFQTQESRSDREIACFVLSVRVMVHDNA